jgi:hypothetical protein
VDRFDLRELAVQLYYTVTGKHDVDDHQWNIILDTFNKRYWREAAKSIGSLLQLDTADLAANIAGGFDYSGSLYIKNAVTQPIKFTDPSWSQNNTTITPNSIESPTGNQDGTLIAATATAGSATITGGVSSLIPGGTLDIFGKAGQGSSSPFLYLQCRGSSFGITWFDLVNGVVANNQVASYNPSITPASFPGFPYQVGVTSTATPIKSPTGWYKCSINLPATESSNGLNLGISDGSTTQNVTVGKANYIWGARRTTSGTGGNTSNMIDPNGVNMITAVELKYLGRYIHLDYEIPQDRYIYNIAFGQIQALIPNAYTIMGEQILLLPKTTGGQILRFSYVPRMADWVDDSAQALNGFLPEWHHVIAYESACLMAASVSPKESEPIMMLRKELRAQWNDFVVSRQRQDGRKIRFVPYE